MVIPATLFLRSIKKSGLTAGTFFVIIKVITDYLPL